MRQLLTIGEGYPTKFNRLLVESLTDLEDMVRDLSGKSMGLVDVETTSRNPSLKSVNPWGGSCWPAGIALTALAKGQTEVNIYYIPVGHDVNLFSSDKNIPLSAAIEALKVVASSWNLAVNQNIKYDMHVLSAAGFEFPCEVEDIMTLAKMHNTDRFLYNLDVLADLYCSKDITPYKKLIDAYLVDNQDYGRVPAYDLGSYAAEDIAATYSIWLAIDADFPDEMSRVRQMERTCTKELYYVEKAGLSVNPTDLLLKAFEYTASCTYTLDALSEELKFPGFNPNSSANMQELFVNRLGLPVVKWTNEDDESKVSNPSFGKEALAEYLVHPSAPAGLVKRIINLRKDLKFLNGFLLPYRKLQSGGKLHADYVQLVRTGRMACRRPNMQQLNADAKGLIIPDEGCGFLSIDQSQIEFRVIVHYINDPRAVAAYCSNPDTDFHTWVAQLANIKRKPAKTVNFLMGYGGGKGTLIKALMKDPDLMEVVKSEVDAMRASGASIKECEEFFRIRAEAIALGVYDTYHRSLPTLKPTSYNATGAAKSKGYIKNLYARRRHLASERAHIAFNSACQGTAADLIKETLCKLGPVVRAYGCSIVAIVHDEILFHGPKSVVSSEDFLRSCLLTMETPTPTIPLRVPVRCSYGYSDKNWLEASKVEAKYPLAKSDWITVKA